MRRCTLKYQDAAPFLNDSVVMGMRISIDHPPASRLVAASHRPSQFAFSVSPPGSTSAS